jgi:hypothetical protein
MDHTLLSEKIKAMSPLLIKTKDLSSGREKKPL